MGRGKHLQTRVTSLRLVVLDPKINSSKGTISFVANLATELPIVGRKESCSLCLLQQARKKKQTNSLGFPIGKLKQKKVLGSSLGGF